MNDTVFPIIERLGGRAVIKRCLPLILPDIKPPAVDAWYTRASLPGQAQRALLGLADAVGLDTTGADFEAMTRETMIRRRLDLANEDRTPLTAEEVARLEEAAAKIVEGLHPKQPIAAE